MAKNPLSEHAFSQLYDAIKQETSSVQRKFDLLYYSKGFFSGIQVAKLVSLFKAAPDRVRAVESIQRRLCRMSCAEAREILACIPISPVDRLRVLNCLKRVLVDNETLEGMEYLLKAFVYEKDKKQALDIMTTVNSYVAKAMPSGGHQIYGANGSLVSQQFPLKEHMYGPIENQLPIRDRPKVPYMPPEATVERVRPSHHALISFAYSKNADKSYYLGGGREPLPPPPVDNPIIGRPRWLGEPRARPLDNHPSFSNAVYPLGLHQGGPVPVGFQDISRADKGDRCCNYAIYSDPLANIDISKLGDKYESKPTQKLCPL